MIKKNSNNFWLDVFMATSFSITILTGLLLWMVFSHGLRIEFACIPYRPLLLVHVFSGVVGLLAVVLHVVWHRDWLKALRGRPLKELPKKLRANRIVDWVIWIAFISTNVFGLAAFLFDQSQFVPSITDRLHTASGIVLILFVVLHLVFHRKWIVNSIRRFVHVRWQSPASNQVES